MQWFLERISARSLPVNFGTKERKEHPQDFANLVKKKILKRVSNLDSVDCEFCEESHQCQVREDKNTLFYVCENGNGRQDVADEELAVYEYDNDAFVELLVDELGLKVGGSTNAKNYIGEYKGKKLTARVFYLRTKDDVVGTDFGSGPRILVSNVGSSQKEEQGVFYCALAVITAMKESKNLFDKVAFEQCVSGARRVLFDKRSGQLYLDGKRIYTVSLTGPEYHFLAYLWDNWEKQMSHSDIFRCIRKKMGKEDFADTAQNFCAKMKSNIKQKCKVIDKVITIPTRGRYMMADPI